MKLSFSNLRAVLAVISLLLLTSTVVWSQAETGQILGTVTDASGAVIPGVPVTIISVDRGFSRTVTSSGSGVYRITNLEPGSYEVSISQQGFAPFKRRLQVTVGSRNTVDAALSVKGAGTTVEVTAEGGAQVNTSDQSISQVVTGTQITQLPTITRDPYDLVSIAGNAAPAPEAQAGSTRGAGFTLNGLRTASNDILLDGAENRDEFVAGVGQPVPIDSVQEFRVTTSDFTAEYGRAAGGIINVATKSGTNNFHGSLYEFNRISALAANSYQNNATGVGQDRFTRNQFGYSIGGPIIKNKLFFFNSIEWTRVRAGLTTQGVVPTPALLAISAPQTQAFFSSLGTLRPDAQLGQTLTLNDLSADLAGPVTGIPATTPILQRVNFRSQGDSGGGLPQNTYFGVARIDYNISDRTTLFGRYAGDHENQFSGTVSTSPYAGFETGTNVLNQNALISVAHTFSSNKVSQTKFTFNRLNLVQPLGSAGVVPGLFPTTNTPFALASNGLDIFFPGYLPLSPANALPFGGPQNLYQAFEDFSWVKGNHNFRIGGQYLHIRDNRTFGAFETGFETLGRSGHLEQVLNNFVAGNLRQFQGAVDPQGKFPCFNDPTTATPIVTPACQVSLPASPPQFFRNNRYNDGSFYLQDSWKIFPRFTLNLGVRWEYYGPQHNANPALDSNFYPGVGAMAGSPTATVAVANSTANNANGNLPITPAQVANGQVLIANQSPVGQLWDPTANNWAPRIGFAWDIFGNGTSSLRGGYGINYERNFGNVTFNVIQNPPAYGVISIRPTDVGGNPIPITTSNFGPLGQPLGTVNLPPTSLRAVDPHISTAYAHTYSLAFEQQIAKNTVVSLEYSGSRGVHQYSISDVNLQGSGVVYLGLDPTVVDPTTRSNTQFSNINFRGSQGDSYYNALNVRVQSSNFANIGLTLTTNYTWAHAIDNLSTTFSETANAFNLGFTDPFHPGLDRGNADFDIRHRITFSAIYEPPIAKDSTGWVRQVLGGWSVAPIFSAYTGYPFSVYDCTNANEVCPRYAASSAISSVTGDSNAPDQGQNVFNYLVLPSRSDFTSPLLGFSDFGVCTTPGEGNTGTISTIGGGTRSAMTSCPYPTNMTQRNTFRGPNHWDFDLGVYKSFKLTEKVGLQLRGEAFNLFNHPNLFVVGSSADVASTSLSPGSGGCPSTGADVCPLVIAKKGGLGLNPTLDTRERRNMQLGVKITF